MKHHIKQITSVGSYIALACLIMGATFVLVLMGKGYVFNFRTGEVAGGGLVLVKSEPGEADIFVDNVAKGKSPKRIPLKAGRYQLKLVKAGYRDWQKSIRVEPSTVSWQQYPFMIPDSLSTNTIAPLENPSVFAQSANTKYFAIAQNSAAPKVEIYEVNKNKPRVAFNMPAENIAQNMRITAVEWSRDNEHLLIRGEGMAGVNYFVTNISNPDNTVNVNKNFNLPIDNLRFSHGNWQDLYWLDAGGLRRIDLNQNTVTGVLADQVVNYTVTPEAIFFVRRQVATNQVLRLIGSQPHKVLVSNLPPNDLDLGFIDYGGKRQIILHDKTTRRVSLYPNTETSGEKLVEYKNIDVKDYSVSKDNRFLLMHGELNFATIDFEFTKLYRFSLGIDAVNNITWFDRYHLLGTVGNSAVIFEYDGGNPETLISASQSFPAFSADAQNLLYTVGKSPINNQPVLQSTRIKR